MIESLKKLNTNDILQRLNIDCKSNKLTKTRFYIFEFSQQLEYYSIEKLCENLTKFDSIENYSYIIHDKDINENGDFVKPHFHCIIRLHNALALALILIRLDTTAEHIEKIKRYDSAIAYLTHRNAPEKYQYPLTDIVSNYDLKEIESFIDSASKPLTDKDFLESLLAKYMNLELNEIELLKQVNVSLQLKYKRLIDDATKIRNKNAINKIKRNINIYFICGESGSGKTTLSQFMIMKKYGFENISISATGKNIFDDYNGQRAFILDDFIPNNENISYKDFLKIIDPYTSSPVNARYFNKSLFDLKEIYITSTETPYFYLNYNELTGGLTQFYRRLKYQYFLIEKPYKNKDFRKIYLIEFNFNNGQLQEKKIFLRELTAEFNEYLSNLIQENENIF